MHKSIPPSRVQQFTFKLRLTFATFFLYSIISTIAVPLALFEQLTRDNLLDSFIIGAGSTYAVGLAIYLLKFFTRNLIRNHDANESNIYGFTLFGVIGLIRGLIVYYTINTSEFNQPSELSLRLLTSTATAIFWLSLISIALEDFESFRTWLKNAISRNLLVNAHSGTAKLSENLSPQTTSQLLRIELSLQKAFTQLHTVDDDMIAYERISREINQIIDNQIRPLSRVIWYQQRKTSANERNLGVLLSSLRFLRLQPRFSALAIGLLSLININTETGVVDNLILTLACSSSVYFLSKFYLKYLASRFQGSLLLNMLFLFTCGITASALLQFINSFLFKQNFSKLEYVYVPTIFIFLLGVSSYQLIRINRSLTFKQLGELSPNWLSTTSEQNRFAEEQLSSYLHNNLQSELLALSNSLLNPESINSRNTPAAAHNFSITREKVSLLTEFDNFFKNPLERLNLISSRWKGIADVQISIPGECLGNPQRDFFLVQIVEEAIANSVRHSKSKQIRIQASADEGDEICLQLWGDGQATEKVESGFGTEWLNHYVAGKWRSRFSNGQTFIEIRI